MINKEPKRLDMKSTYSLWNDLENNRLVQTSREQDHWPQKCKRHNQIYNISSARNAENKGINSTGKLDLLKTHSNFKESTYDTNTMAKTGRSFFTTRNNLKSQGNDYNTRSKDNINNIFQKTSKTFNSQVRLKTSQISKISHEYPTLKMKIINDVYANQDRSNSPNYDPNVFSKDNRKLQNSFLVKFDSKSKNLPKDKLSRSKKNLPHKLYEDY